MTVYRRILGYLRPYSGVFILSLVSMVVYAALDAFSFTLLMPFLDILFEGQRGTMPADVSSNGAIGQVLDQTIGGLVEGRPAMQALRNVVLLLFGVYLIKNVALYLQQLSIAVLEGRVTRDIRDHVYSHLVRLGFPFFQRTRAGQIISRATVDVDHVRTLVTANLARAISSVIQVIFYLGFLLLISWKLTLIAMLFLPPMLGLWARFRQRLKTGVVRVLDAVGDVASQLQETVSGIRLVKASGAEPWEEKRFRALTSGHYTALVRNERWRQFFPPATEMVIATAILGLLWYGSFLVLEEASLDAAAFLVCLGLAMKLMAPAKFLGQFPATVQPGLAAAERVFEILDTPEEIRNLPGAKPLPEFRDAVRFEKVGFAYQPGEPVLQDVELEIRPGEVVALVGPSGGGKSTLADLLPRFHDPSSGRITVDGLDIREVRLEELRSLMGIVTQETILFHDTIRANIAYGSDDPLQSGVEEAARAANAHDFIVELPDGYDTLVGERGVRLSGGQRQRLAIARALYRNPPILILDEATSALDTESEHLVQSAIDELMQHRTVLVIAHRLSTVRNADQILVIDRGRIVERGSHLELLARGGMYERLYRMQFDDEPSATAPSESA